MSPAAAPGLSDGARLNLTAQLAQVAADLQKIKSTRSGKAEDAVLVAALNDVGEAVALLCRAVGRLSAEVQAAETQLVVKECPT